MYNRSLLGALFDRILISKFKYRDRASIIKDILETVNGDAKGKTKTSIMRGANLNFEQVNRYLDFLTLSDVVRATSPLKGQELARYRITQRGLKFLRSTEIWNLVMYPYQHQTIT